MKNELLCGAGYRLEQYLLYWITIANGSARDRNGNPPDESTRQKAEYSMRYVFEQLLRNANADQDALIEYVSNGLGRKWPRPEFERIKSP